MPKQVMVLEDEQMLFELLRDLLGMEGYQVTRPKRFDNLMQELRTARPDAVLIDVNLEEVNGLDLLSQIRSDKKLNDMAVVLSSGMDYRQQSLQGGADAFLMKPYTPSDLVEILKAKLND